MKAFLEFVEIRTKLASQLPLLLGTGYVLYSYKVFEPFNLLFMFLSLLTFDMATTSINNYYDYKKSIKKSGYGYENHNAIVYFSMNEIQVKSIISVLLFIAGIFGIILFINTSIIVLLAGVISFATGILYSFGPVPISRTPFGELLSGVIMGFIIPFLAIYIHIYNSDLIVLTYQNGMVNFAFDMTFMIRVILLTVAPIVCIANIMLANNICDMEDDFINKRYTLPLYIGKEKALAIYKWLYFIAYVSILTLIIMKALPLISLVTLITILPIKKNIDKFYKEQQKSTTFALALKNLIILVGALSITLYIGAIMKLLF